MPDINAAPENSAIKAARIALNQYQQEQKIAYKLKHLFFNTHYPFCNQFGMRVFNALEELLTKNPTIQEIKEFLVTNNAEIQNDEHAALLLKKAKLIKHDLSKGEYATPDPETFETSSGEELLSTEDNRSPSPTGSEFG